MILGIPHALALEKRCFVYATISILDVSLHEYAFDVTRLTALFIGFSNVIYCFDEFAYEFHLTLPLSIQK